MFTRRPDVVRPNVGKRFLRASFEMQILSTLCPKLIGPAMHVKQKQAQKSAKDRQEDIRFTKCGLSWAFWATSDPSQTHLDKLRQPASATHELRNDSEAQERTPNLQGRSTERATAAQSYDLSCCLLYVQPCDAGRNTSILAQITWLCVENEENQP